MYVSLDTNTPLGNTYKRQIWLYQHANFSKMTRDRLIQVENTKWSELLQCGSIDDACDVFTNTFLDIARECIPTKTVIIRPNDK